MSKQVETAAGGGGESITIAQIKMNESKINIIGTSPLVPHAVSAKGKGQLLFPSPKKNAAEKATSMKHEPLEEYRDAAYVFTDEDEQPTRLYMPAGAFHGAMSKVAIDMAGAKKAQIGRLTKVLGNKIPIWGVPKLWMTVVRSSDMARTPDIRSLPLLTEWCCTIYVEYVASLIKEQSIVNLLAAAGVIVGVGDGRPEKGKLDMGCFRLCNEDDKDFVRIKKTMATKAQDAALREPDFYDKETAQLYGWFLEEKKRRAAAPAAGPKSSKKKTSDAVVIAPTTNGKGVRAAQ